MQRAVRLLQRLVQVRFVRVPLNPARFVVALLVIASCGPAPQEIKKPTPPIATTTAPVRHDDTFRGLVIADIPSWSEPRRFLVDLRGGRAIIITSAPPGLRVLEGTFNAGKIDVAEHTTRTNALSIVATRDGDHFTGEWREGRDHHAFTTRKPSALAPRGGEQTWSGWIGSDRIRARTEIAHGEMRGALFHLASGERTLTGDVDALGQLHLEESRDGTKAVWHGALLDPSELAAWRSVEGEPDRLVTLSFTSSYPRPIALWDVVALAPEVYHAESSRECWADTTIFHVTGLADGSKTSSLDLEIARFIGVRRLDVVGCFGGGERWSTVTWKKPPFVQLELKSSTALNEAGRCTILDLERGHVVKLFDLVKDHVALDRFATVTGKATRCYTEEDGPHHCPDVHVAAATSTMCMEGDHVTVEDDGLPQVSIPKSEIPRIFDVRSPIGRSLF